MRIPGARSRTFSTNSLFAAFSLAVIGWGLLHTWGASLKMGILPHALAAMPGLALTGGAIYRYRQHWPVKPPGFAMPDQGDAKRSRDYRDATLYPVLAGAGFGIALAINSGSLFMLLLAALGMLAVPWTKISVCRDHFFLAAGLVQSGVLAGMGLLAGPPHPLHFPMAAWLLLSVTCIVLISVIGVHGNRLDRMPVSGYQETTPSSA